MASVTILHAAKAVGRNEMPFIRDTRVVPINIVWDSGPDIPTGRRNLGSEPQSKFALQIAAKTVTDNAMVIIDNL